jgi:uncharacterized protein
MGNVEVVRSGNEAFNSGDFDGLAERYAPDAELVDLRNAPDQPSVVKSRAAIRETAALWAAEFESFRADIDELVDAGAAVVCSVRWHGRGKASGVSVDVRQFDVYELSDGQVVRATLGFESREEAMEAAAESNVALMRFCYDAFARGDIEVLVALADPEMEIVESDLLPGPRTYRGPEGLLEAFDNWAGQFDDFSVEVERIACAGDKVVVQARHRGRGKESGVPVEARVSYVHTLRDGKGVRWEMFATWEEALAAAGPQASAH